MILYITKCGTAPQLAAFAVAIKEIDGINISSPGNTPASIRLKCRAEVPLTVAAYVEPVNSAGETQIYLHMNQPRKHTLNQCNLIDIFFHFHQTWVHGGE